MDVNKTNQEILHEGWLIKSPPSKLWRVRWRKRWFTLRHSSELPCQYVLEYYRDRRCRKIKGMIDLNQCEQVDSGLKFEGNKLKYQFMFNVKTPKRTYYLAAEDEADMNKWVDIICKVCGFNIYTPEGEQHAQILESPSLSPVSTVSGLYIPISECISGRSTNMHSSLGSISQEHYDAPRKLASSPTMTADAESVFTDDERSSPIPSANCENHSDESKNTNNEDHGLWSVQKSFGKLKIADDTDQPKENPVPPRPPKPHRMLPENPGHNYLNLDGATESSKPATPVTSAPSTPSTTVVTDETYDFPRSHNPALTNTNTIGRSKHCYSNAAPSNNEDRIFRYDFHEEKSTTSSMENMAIYSNFPNSLVQGKSTSVPSVMPPPVVYRELKPRKKMSDSVAMSSDEPSPNLGIVLETCSAEHSGSEPPSINRKLKPSSTKSPLEGSVKSNSPPGRGKVKSVSSPLSLHSNSTRDRSPSENKNCEEEIYYYQRDNTFTPASNRHTVFLQYLDLDLEKNDGSINSSTPVQSTPSTTVYKTVDFLKTEAFNRTRQKVEEERKQCSNELS